MDAFEAIQERRSIRSYQDTPVPRDKLEKILEAGRLASPTPKKEKFSLKVDTQSFSSSRLW